MHDAVIVAIELHEYQVPNLDIAVAILFWGAGWSTRYVWAVVIKNFGARTARTGIAHGPEIIRLILTGTRFVADARQTLRRYADFVQPNVGGFVVFVIHRDP